jgi:hypothetical protein
VLIEPQPTGASLLRDMALGLLKYLLSGLDKGRMGVVPLRIPLLAVEEIEGAAACVQQTLRGRHKGGHTSSMAANA